MTAAQRDAYREALRIAEEEASLMSGQGSYFRRVGPSEHGSVVSGVMHDQYAHKARGGLAAHALVAQGSVLGSKGRQIAGGEHYAIKAKSKARRASEERERVLREREHEILRLERESIEKMLKMEEMEARLMRLEKASSESGGGGAGPPRAPAAADDGDDDDAGDGDGYGDDDFEEFEDEDGEGTSDGHIPWDEKKKTKNSSGAQGKKGGGRGKKASENRRPKPMREGGGRGRPEPSARHRAAARNRDRDRVRDKDRDRDDKENVGGNVKVGYKRAPKVSPFIAHQRKFGHIAEKEHRKAMAMAIPGLDRSQPIRIKQSHADVTALGMRGGITMTAEEEQELQVEKSDHDKTPNKIGPVLAPNVYSYVHTHACFHPPA
jgi:hypothetical protein